MNSVHSRHGQENSVKKRKKNQNIKKPLSDIIFSQNSDRQKNRAKIFVPHFVRTRTGEENYEKNSKKIRKMEKPYSGIIYSQNGVIQVEKERKKF